MSSTIGGVERRTAGGVSRGIRAIAMACALVLVATGVLSGAEAAYAKDYPSWSDVVKARKSENATKAEIKRIKALISALAVEVERTAKDAEAKGELYSIADAKYQEAALKAKELQTQADEAKVLAAESKRRAGEMIAGQYRSGSGDVSTNLFMNAGDADDLLYSYGMADQFTEQTSGIYEKAIEDQNSAQSLTDQADIARELLEELKIAAEKAYAVAQEAAIAAAAAFEEQQTRQTLLAAQLKVLEGRRKVTEKDYLAGVRERDKAAASIGAGEISGSGWAKPSGGRITSNFGYRVNPSGYHLGTDLGAGCGGNIYAAHSGTVVYAGYNGVYGQYIRISHGGGVETEYGHIMNGGIKVRSGQSIGVGALIAKAGATGIATGCHLHFGVRINGLVTNPVPFMRNQGIRLG
ncbi:M23 family peptidase [Glaciihabitans arcticus]|uniref:M23 family peptidase n=1 Tax=Glaciihabitans arcticus TaxID=2668039 RepID=A0A4Q9GSI2_9MICO|nr:M23 family metallopeptidase [Glaciihabitans arcticus]TBN57976.1 M23 family peptidase [Glaciihabitans arcticus]